MRRVVFAIFGTIAGLVGLLSFKTQATPVASAPAAVSTTGPGTAATGTAATGSSTSSTSTAAAGSASTKATSTTATTTVTGSVVNTRWGPVQVRITVTNGKLVSATAIQYPNGNGRDQQINAYAIPALTKEALAAGSAKIDMISGASYTSQGYISSLQSALDKAGL
jgi:uncharacterized protein with FMN-binding domain